MLKRLLILLLPLVFFMASCEKDKPFSQSAEVKGFVQKGPFNNGTSITISELEADLAPTGRNFNTEVFDNSGSFGISGIELASPYVELKANGFYFDEITGENSPAPITLYALTDLSDSADININILSTIEKRRVEFLISQGVPFKEAKRKAQQEILKIFEIDTADISSSEFLNISKSGEGNAILLAISAILQGYNTTSELSELLANIGSDIREDGELNDSVIGSTLVNNARYLFIDSIRSNLESKYQDLGTAVQIPEYEKYIKNFIDSTGFTYTNLIKYPEDGIYGKNILAFDSITVIEPGSDMHFSMRAFLPEKVRISVMFIFTVSGVWEINGFNTGWNTELNSINKFIFVDSDTKDNLDLELVLFDHGTLTIYIYENNKPVSSREVKISW
jgi:hypothetical protein